MLMKMRLPSLVASVQRLTAVLTLSLCVAAGATPVANATPSQVSRAASEAAHRYLANVVEIPPLPPTRDNRTRNVIDDLDDGGKPASYYGGGGDGGGGGSSWLLYVGGGVLVLLLYRARSRR